MMQDRKRPSRKKIVSTCKVRCNKQHCFLQGGGTLVLLDLLEHDLALRKPSNINQKCKPGPNTVVTQMGW